jgi:hypothetical protein
MAEGSGAGDATWIADTGLFVACGRQDNEKYTALSRFARRRGISFRIPGTVHEELGGAPERSTPGSVPVDEAIRDGWVTVVGIDYTDPVVSTVMDDARRFIANTSNRDEDGVEKADTALAGVAARLLSAGEAEAVRIVTTDRDAGTATVEVLQSHGFDGQVEWCDGFDLLEQLV